MKLHLLKNAIIVIMLLTSLGIINGQNVNSVFTSNAGIWISKHDLTTNVADGHLNASMVDQGANYRNDLTSDGNTVSLNPATDVIFAMKFIGDRPSGNLKFEMQDENGHWYNGYASFDGSFSTNTGNMVYYWDLSSDATYAALSVVVNITKMNIIVADATTAPFSYSIDWIKTFNSLYATKVGANIDDDGSSDKEELLFQSFATAEYGALWETQSNSTSNFANGHLDVTMADQGTSYRGDLWYNYSSSSSKNLGFNPSEDQFLAVKFIGTRPDGALKLEMQTEGSDGSLSWFNTKWNGGSADGSTTTSSGNTIYYFDLTKDGGYTGTSDILIRRVHFVIADAKVTPYNYSIDWLGTFASVATLEAFKNTKDDGVSDSEGVATAIVKNTKVQSNVFAKKGSIEIVNCEPGVIVTVYSIAGKMVSQVVASSLTVHVNCNAGLYVVKIQGNSISTTKILVQ